MSSEEFNPANHGLWTRGLLIRRKIAVGDLADFTDLVPGRNIHHDVGSAEGHRWAIEDRFETEKNEFGLDHDETVSWHGRHRRVSFVMRAFAMMAAIQHRANTPPPKKARRKFMAVLTLPA